MDSITPVSEHCNAITPLSEFFYHQQSKRYPEHRTNTRQSDKQDTTSTDAGVKRQNPFGAVTLPSVLGLGLGGRLGLGLRGGRVMVLPISYKRCLL